MLAPLQRLVLVLGVAGGLSCNPPFGQVVFYVDTEDAVADETAAISFEVHEVAETVWVCFDERDRLECPTELAPRREPLARLPVLAGRDPTQVTVTVRLHRRGEARSFYRTSVRAAVVPDEIREVVLPIRSADVDLAPCPLGFRRHQGECVEHCVATAPHDIGARVPSTPIPCMEACRSNVCAAPCVGANCDPSRAVDRQYRCGDDGVLALVESDCALGCFDESRCAQPPPAFARARHERDTLGVFPPTTTGVLGVDGRQCPPGFEERTLSLRSTGRIFVRHFYRDTSPCDVVVRDDGDRVGAPIRFRIVRDPSGARRVFEMASLVLDENSTIELDRSSSVVLLVHEQARIDGELVVETDRDAPVSAAPGGGSSGGGGGSFGSSGARGGGPAGGNAGSPTDLPDVLRGGFSGGDGDGGEGGDGGGAMELAAQVISFGPTATLSANGGRGRDATEWGGAGGGGSGGLIILTAARIELNPRAVGVRVDGGAGGLPFGGNPRASGASREGLAEEGRPGSGGGDGGGGGGLGHVLLRVSPEFVDDPDFLDRIERSVSGEVTRRPLPPPFAPWPS